MSEKNKVMIVVCYGIEVDKYYGVVVLFLYLLIIYLFVDFDIKC